MFDLAERIAKEQGLVESGDDIAIAAGVPLMKLSVQTHVSSLRAMLSNTNLSFQTEKLEW